ncbi:MAG: hypothetical protein PVI90_00190 [Desulfobacteraceae bacterium]|jgi:hypothetical protein
MTDSSIDQNKNNLLQLFVDIGVFTAMDTVRFKQLQVKALIKLLLEKKALIETQRSLMEVFLHDALSTNAARRVRGQMSIIDFITNKQHKRISNVSEKVANHKNYVVAEYAR